MLDDLKKFFDTQIEELHYVKNNLNSSFEKAVQIITSGKGELLIIGIGKTGIIGSKIAATLTSIGLRTIYINAAEAIHGDLGMIKKDDVVIIISYSGNTNETIELIPHIKKRNCKLIAITGNEDSKLAKNANVVMNIKVRNEGNPLSVIPMASTTATLLIGDALAFEIIKNKNISIADFAKNHPGGSIGRSLLTKVYDVMSKKIPTVDETSNLDTILKVVGDFRLGMTLVKNTKKYIGLITDGDIRRGISNQNEILGINAKDLMTRNFLTINYDAMAKSALKKMKENKVTSLVVIENEKIVGVVTINQLLLF